LRFHFTRHVALAVRVKLPVHARAVKLIESHSQSFPTLHVATDQDQLTVILEDQVMLQLDIVNRLLLTGIVVQKSISISFTPRATSTQFTFNLPVHFGIKLISIFVDDPTAVSVIVQVHPDNW
jgi:hypothetical protein